MFFLFFFLESWGSLLETQVVIGNVLYCTSYCSVNSYHVFLYPQDGVLKKWSGQESFWWFGHPKSHFPRNLEKWWHVPPASLSVVKPVKLSDVFRTGTQSFWTCEVHRCSMFLVPRELGDCFENSLWIPQCWPPQVTRRWKNVWCSGPRGLPDMSWLSSLREAVSHRLPTRLMLCHFVLRKSHNSMGKNWFGTTAFHGPTMFFPAFSKNSRGKWLWLYHAIPCHTSLCLGFRNDGCHG